jgi:hypothetical protein
MPSSLTQAEQDKLERLRAAVQEGLDDVARGDVIEIEWDQLDQWLDSLGREPMPPAERPRRRTKR